MRLTHLVMGTVLAVLPVQGIADVFRSGQAWGAIAYAPEAGEWGWARQFATRFGAEQAALAQCRGAATHGCRVVSVMQAACGALAVGREGWGAGGGASPALARAHALASCQRNTRHCTIRLDQCSSPPGAPIAVFR